eukprot:scaffold990_cov393-Prasinococcus_capsulatus_cf.AAC.33
MMIVRCPNAARRHRAPTLRDGGDDSRAIGEALRAAEAVGSRSRVEDSAAPLLLLQCSGGQGGAAPDSSGGPLG